MSSRSRCHRLRVRDLRPAFTPRLLLAILVTLLGSPSGSVKADLTLLGGFPDEARKRYQAVDLDSARRRVYEMFSEKIEDRGPGSRSTAVDAGSILLYQTNEGRFGKLIVGRHRDWLWVRWTSWSIRPREITIHGEGHSGEMIPPTSFDLDAGTVHPASGEMDFTWSYDLEGQLELEPRNGARFAHLEGSFSWAELPPSILRTTPVSFETLGFPGTSYEGASIHYRTDEGRFGKLRVFDTVGGLLRDIPTIGLELMTFEADDSLRVHTRPLPSLLGSGDAIDLESGMQVSSGRGVDIMGCPGRGLLGVQGDVCLQAANGAVFGIYGQKGPDLEYESIDLETVRYAPLRASEISRADLLPGAIVLYRTAQGRWGKFRVLDGGYDLVVKHRTFNSSTGVWSAEGRMVVPGTAVCDLDIGRRSVDEFSVHGDFRWAPVTDSDRRLQPRNGALFAVTVAGHEPVPVREPTEKLEAHRETSVAGSGIVSPTGEFRSLVTRFLRGDVDSDGEVDIQDAHWLTQYLTGGFAPTCLDAADVDDDGTITESDVVLLYRWITDGGVKIPPPAGLCGVDPTPGDALDCQQGECP